MKRTMFLLRIKAALLGFGIGLLVGVIFLICAPFCPLFMLYRALIMPREKLVALP